METVKMASGERVGATGGRDATARVVRTPSRWALLAALLVLPTGALSAGAAEFAGEEPIAVREAIGGGIHAFHARDYDGAYNQLTDAIEAGSDDPRGYYFRGLAALRLGRASEAQADFTTGADRETVTGSTRRVSQALERVQGPDRLTLERYRTRARLSVLQREREAFGRRYSGIEDATRDVRRRRRPEDVRPELVAPRQLPEGDPLPAPTDVEEVPMPKSRPAKPGDSFEDEPEEAADDPFGASSTPEKGMKKSAEADDPFGN